MANLRDLLQLGLINEDDPAVQNYMAQLLGGPQPDPSIAPMQQNTMRFENGPDQGRVVPLNFPQQQAQAPQQALGDPVEYMGRKGRYSLDGREIVFADGTRTPVNSDAAFKRAKEDFLLKHNQQTLDKGKLDMEKEREMLDAFKAQRDVREDTTSQAYLQKKYGKAPEGQRWTDMGSLEDIPGANGKPLNESQAKAAGMGTRAQAAHELLLGLEGKGVTTPGLIKQAAESVPVIGGALGMAVNMSRYNPVGGQLIAPSEDQNKVEQAQRDFVNAVLRPESGASINPSEFQNAYRQYFPQPGDTDAVIQQKQQAREREIAALSVMAGSNGAKAMDRQNASNRQKMQSADRSKALFEAKDAIRRGAPKEAVRQRLQQNGIDPAEAGL